MSGSPELLRRACRARSAARRGVQIAKRSGSYEGPACFLSSGGASLVHRRLVHRRLVHRRLVHRRLLFIVSWPACFLSSGGSGRLRGLAAPERRAPPRSWRPFWSPILRSPAGPSGGRPRVRPSSSRCREAWQRHDPRGSSGRALSTARDKTEGGPPMAGGRRPVGGTLLRGHLLEAEVMGDGSSGFSP